MCARGRHKFICIVLGLHKINIGPRNILGSTTNDLYVVRTGFTSIEVEIFWEEKAFVTTAIFMQMIIS